MHKCWSLAGGVPLVRRHVNQLLAVELFLGSTRFSDRGGADTRVHSTVRHHSGLANVLATTRGNAMVASA